jgi:hypothetical protein
MILEREIPKMQKTLYTATALGLVLSLSACGGAGGGGVNSPGTSAPPLVVTPAPTPTPAPAPTPTPTPAPTPTPTASPYASEDARSSAALVMKADAAYKAGLTGKGVTIAIIDTGIDTGGKEFAGRISADSTAFDQKIARCATCDSETIRFDLKDQNGHGTETAAAALAARDTIGMHGIAPEATLLALKISGPNLNGVTPGNGPIAESDGPNAALIAPAIAYAVDKGAFAISMSLNGFAGGQMATDMRAAMDQVRIKDRIFVQSVSNDVGVDSFAGQIAENLVGTDLTNKDWFLFGIRVDKNLQPPSGNGLPGQLADRTLAVVATNVDVVGKDGTIVTVTGNSFAAPAIAGAAALLKQYWPQLGGKDISRILLDSATDLGAPGVDQVFGVGLLNVENAMKAKIPTVVTSSAKAAETAVASLEFSGAFGSGQGAGKWSEFAGRAVAIDAYGRDYAVDLGLRGNARAARGISVYGMVAAPTQPVPTPSSVQQVAALTSNDMGTTNHPVRSTAPASFAFRTSPTSVVRGSFNGSVEDGGLASGSLFRTLGLATTGSSGSFETNGYVYGFSSAASNDRGSRSATQTMRMRVPQGFSVSMSTSRESGSALGLRGSGDFRIAGAQSRFVSVGWQGEALGFGLSAEAMAGRTKVDARSARLAFDSISSSGFRLQADHGAFGGTATFGLTSPLKVDSARISYTAPMGFDLTSLDVADRTRSLDLAPGAREMDVELGWARGFGTSYLSLGAVYGFNAGNQTGASSAGGWVRFGKAF